MANEDSRFAKAWELISSGEDTQAINFVIAEAMEGDLEALSIIAIANINLGNWQDCDRYIQIAGDNGGRDFWLAGQTENHVYSAFIARLDAFADINSNKFSHFESTMMVNQYLMQRDEPGAFPYTIRSMRCLFAGPGVKEDFELYAAGIFIWVHLLKKEGLVDEKSLGELLEAISWTTTCAFDLKFSLNLMNIYNSDWK